MSAVDSISIPRKVWTRADVENLLLPDRLPSLELINGELIDKRMGKNRPHTFWIGSIGKWLRQQFDDDYVRSESLIDVAPEDNATSEPEPDLVVTLRSRRELRYEKVQPKDVVLVVEISDSTYDYDRTVKAALYARAGIAEYWVVDILDANAPVLVRHLMPLERVQSPTPRCAYQIVTTCGCGDALVFKGYEFRLKDLG